ncbi:hypothetical protein K6U06_07695 [Acidiferrimicrobium sp. IK]|uniref:hypothetical protein n=1 Tax=Acidiferrimicrobium sp. IK TaxID=2871700 RepID=UPI0021CB0388|nr:hypothetical protein [Acidiferrimicrobium sp. IK]MCU4184240.1 hypothetical protein [Acidiferrimicrobium sp. IK]
MAYVNAVLAQLNHVYGDVSRQDLAAMSLPKTSAAMLRAIFNDPLFTQELSVATNGLLGDLSNVRRPPGDRVTRVVRLLSASPTCIFAQTSTDYSKVLVKEGQPVGAEYYELTPKAPGNDPQHLNPTPWAIQANEAFSTPPPTVPPNPCAG